MGRPLRLHAGFAALAAALALAGPALAQSPLQEYQRTGRITPCKYGSGQLNGGVPNDVAQYAPDYASALRGASRANCGGGAGGGAGGSGAGGAAGGGPGEFGGPGGAFPSVNRPPAPPPVLGRVKRPQASREATDLPSTARTGTPLPILLLGMVALVALAITAAAGLARLLGWGGSERMAALRHAFDELRYRAGGPFDGPASDPRI